MIDNPLLVKCPHSGEHTWCADDCTASPHCRLCVCHGDGLVIPPAPEPNEMEKLKLEIAMLKRSCAHYAVTIRCPICKYNETFGEPFLMRAAPSNGYPYGYFFCDTCGITADFVEPRSKSNG